MSVDTVDTHSDTKAVEVSQRNALKATMNDTCRNVDSVEMEISVAITLAVYRTGI